MVLIMVTGLFPPEKIVEVAKKHLEVTQKFPKASFEKRVMGGTRATKKGVKDIMIIEIEEGKCEEALSLTARRLFEYFSIEGYQVEVETLLTLKESMPILESLHSK